MNDPMIIAGALAIVIPLLATAIAKVILAFGQMKNDIVGKLNVAADKLDVTASKLDEAAIVQEEIHKSVNGNSRIAEDKLKALEDKIEGLNLALQRVQELRIDEAKASDPTKLIPVVKLIK